MVLSRVGVGAATVDTVLPDREFEPGEAVEASVEMAGGNSQQTVENIYLKLVADNHASDDGAEHVLETYELLDEPVVLEPETTRTEETELTLPRWTPVSVPGELSVRFDTSLDIEWAVDPTDADEIAVVPGERADALLTAVENLEFTRVGARLVDGVSWVDDRPFVQKFAFVPEAEPFTEQLDMLGVTFVPRADHLEVAVEVDQVDAVADDPEFESKAEGGDASRLLGDWAESLRDFVLVGDSHRESRFEDEYGKEVDELGLAFDKQESVHTFEHAHPDQMRNELTTTIRENTDRI